MEEKEQYAKDGCLPDPPREILEAAYKKFKEQIPEWVHPDRFYIRYRFSLTEEQWIIIPTLHYPVPVDVTKTEFTVSMHKLKYPVLLTDWLTNSEKHLAEFRKLVNENPELLKEL